MVVACSETLLNASNSSLVEMSIFCEKSLEESPVTVGLRLVFQALIQYSLAVDRGNEKVAYLYEPGHPAVLRLIKSVVEVAHRNNLWVGMCGEMSGEPIFTLLLLGMGLDRFSMSPPQVPIIKELMNNVNLKDAEGIANKVLSFSTAQEVEDYLHTELKRNLKEDFYRNLMI